MDAGAAVSPPYGRHPMLDEALDLVQAARADGLQVRLIGGLAVLAQCGEPDLCRREYRDLDVVGSRRRTGALLATFARLGYEENRHVRLASAGAVLQVQRPCRHGRAGRRLHPDDRVDVYLDAFRQQHELPLAGRLELEPFTVAVADVLLAKLLRTRPGAADLHDVVALLAGVPLGQAEGPGVLSLRRTARVCARDWGLWRDVSANLGRVRDLLPRTDLDETRRGRVTAALDELDGALAGGGKSLRWRLRALVGERLPWYDAVDENDGVRIGALERPTRAA